jgi:hypothetical protein
MNKDYPDEQLELFDEVKPIPLSLSLQKFTKKQLSALAKIGIINTSDVTFRVAVNSKGFSGIGTDCMKKLVKIADRNKINK